MNVGDGHDWAVRPFRVECQACHLKLPSRSTGSAAKFHKGVTRSSCDVGRPSAPIDAVAEIGRYGIRIVVGEGCNCPRAIGRKWWYTEGSTGRKRDSVSASEARIDNCRIRDCDGLVRRSLNKAVMLECNIDCVCSGSCTFGISLGRRCHVVIT